MSDFGNLEPVASTCDVHGDTRNPKSSSRYSCCCKTPVIVSRVLLSKGGSHMRLTLFVGALSLTLVLALAQSQLGTGAIAGVVQDSSAASVTGAEVTLTNKETGLVRKMVSGAGGQFAAPVLPTGTYKLRVSHAGFSALEQDDIVVNVGSTATVIAELKVGGIAETVTVEATVAIDSAKTDESSLIDRKLIQDLPINGRRYYDFALLAAGVTRDAR